MTEEAAAPTEAVEETSAEATGSARVALDHLEVYHGQRWAQDSSVVDLKAGHEKAHTDGEFRVEHDHDLGI